MRPPHLILSVSILLLSLNACKDSCSESGNVNWDMSWENGTRTESYDFGNCNFRLASSHHDFYPARNEVLILRSPVNSNTSSGSVIGASIYLAEVHPDSFQYPYTFIDNDTTVPNRPNFSFRPSVNGVSLIAGGFPWDSFTISIDTFAVDYIELRYSGWIDNGLGDTIKVTNGFARTGLLQF